MVLNLEGFEIQKHYVGFFYGERVGMKDGDETKFIELIRLWLYDWLPIAMVGSGLRL